MRSILVTYGGVDRSNSNEYGYGNIWGWGNGGRESGVMDRGPKNDQNDLEGDKKGQGRGRNDLWVGNSFSDGWIVPLAAVAGPKSDG